MDLCFFFSSRRRHTRCSRDWSSDVCSSDLDVADAPARIEAGKGILKDHLHAPADLVLARGGIGDIHPVELDAAARRPIESDDDAGDGRLAAAGFADEREGLAAAYREADAVDGLEPT